MKSWKEKGAEELQKQKWLDDIHTWPEVKPTFILNEVFMFFTWIGTMLFMGAVGYALNFGILAEVADFLDIGGLIYAVVSTFGGPVVSAAFLVAMLLLGRFKSHSREKLEKLERDGLAKVQAAVADGTYVPGPGPGKAYRIYSGIRTISMFAGLIFMAVGLFNGYI